MAYCRNCGSELAENAKVCTNCGASIADEIGDNNIQEKDENIAGESHVYSSKDISVEDEKTMKGDRFFWIILLILACINFYSDPAILTIVLSIALIIGCVYGLKKKYKGGGGILLALIISIFCFCAGYSQAGEIGLYVVPGDEPVVEQAVKPSVDKTIPDNKSTASKEDKPVEKAPVVSKEDKKETVKGVNPELKAFLDSYEAFVDEYVAFMKSFMNNPGDALSLLSDYTKFMKKYEEFAKTVDKYDSNKMSPEDAKYYLEVINRCNMKMLEMY